MQPAKYWRDNKSWKNWIGKRGTVVVSTVVTVPPSAQNTFQPYSYAIVSFGGERYEFMGVGHELLIEGDQVECCLRKTSVSEDHEIIGYGIKVRKVT